MSTETGKHQGNKDPRLKEATKSEERGDIWENLREDFRTGARRTNSRIVGGVMKNEELDSVEG
jgi:hypothetical protein